MFSNEFQVNRRIEREQSRLVQLDARFEERKIGTRHYHAGVDELLAVHLWHHANHGIVIPEFIGHE